MERDFQDGPKNQLSNGLFHHISLYKWPKIHGKLFFFHPYKWSYNQLVRAHFFSGIHLGRKSVGKCFLKKPGILLGRSMLVSWGREGGFDVTCRNWDEW